MTKFILVLSIIFSLSLPAFANSGGQWIQSTVSVTSTASKVLNARSGRLYLLIVNKGSEIIYMKVDSGAGAGEGIAIPAGGNYESLYPPFNSVYLKSTSGTVSVELIEG